MNCNFKINRLLSLYLLSTRNLYITDDIEKKNLHSVSVRHFKMHFCQLIGFAILVSYTRGVLGSACSTYTIDDCLDVCEERLLKNIDSIEECQQICSIVEPTFCKSFAYSKGQSVHTTA